MTSVSPWRGHVNNLFYGVDLRSSVTAAEVSHRVDLLLRSDTPTVAVEAVRQALGEALESGQLLGPTEDADEATARDYLSAVVEELERRRPWPSPPVYLGDLTDWPQMRAAPVIGRIQASQDELEMDHGLVFYPVDDGAAAVAVLRLRTGQTVALRGSDDYTATGVDVLSYADPRITRGAVQQLLGLPIAPPAP
jgi:hypothetical protein